MITEIIRIQLRRLFLLFFLFITISTNYGQTPDTNNPVYIVDDAVLDSAFLLSLPEMVLTQESLLRSLPSSVDNSTLSDGYMPPVFDQQMSGSCVHCAEIGYVFTYEMNRYNNVHAGSMWKNGSEIERQNLYHPFFTYNFVNRGKGNYPSSSGDGFKIVSQVGCPAYNDYYNPVLEDDYDPSNPQPFRYWMDGADKYISATENVVLYDDYDTLGIFKISWDSTYASLNNLKRWLANHNSSSNIGGIAVFHSLMDSYGVGAIPVGTPHGNQAILTSWGQSGGHMMTIVGYDDSICVSGNYNFPNDTTLLSNCERGAFKVANSWGPNWMNDGYIWVPYSLMDRGSSFNNHAYTCIASMPEGKTVFLTATIRHPNRERLYLKVGRGDNTSVQIPESDTNYRIFRYQGGAFPMNGDTANPRPIDIGLNFGKLFNPENCGKYFLKVIDRSYHPYENVLPYVDNFSLIDYRWGEVFELLSEHPYDTIKNNDTTLLSIDYDLIYPFEISESYVCYTDKVARRTISVSNNSSFIINEGVSIDMYGTSAYNCELLVDADASIVIGDNAVITAKRGNCIIEVNGDIQIGRGVHFKAENGATLRVIINGQQTVSIEDCYFTNTSLQANVGPNKTVSSICSSSFSINNSFFDTSIGQYEFALRIEGYSNILIADNTVDGLGIMSTRHYTDGILLYNCGTTGINSQILRNTIRGCSETGLTLYGTAANIKGKNEITLCHIGVKLLNGSTVNNFTGNCGASNESQTQHIHDNDYCEVLIHRGCMPQIFRFNRITSTGNGWFVEYEDNVDNGKGLCTRFDLEYNSWGNYTNTQIESRFNYVTNTNNGALFDFLPKWGYGECLSSYDEEAQQKSEEADSLWNIGLYTSAKTSYREIVTLYPNTNSALNVLKKLLMIESNDGENYASLQYYYLNDTTIQGNGNLAALASSLANKCDELMEHYEQAIAWYEAIIENEETPYNDSLFATIDLGNLYLKMEANGTKGLKGKLAQFVPKSPEAFSRQTDEALRKMMHTPRRFNSTHNLPDQYWTDIVTEQPEGYIVDGNGDVHLHSAEALAWFSVVSNGLNGQEVDDFNGKKVTLETDVDMSAAIWTPISERIDASSFKGIFNGNEHIIDGIQLTKTNLYAYKSGFFGNVFEATISNIVMRNGYFEGYGYGIGFLAAQAVKSLINHCFVECEMHGGESVPFIYTNNGSYITNSLVYCQMLKNETNGDIRGVFVAENMAYNGDLTLPLIQNCASIVEKMNWTENCGLSGVFNHGVIENCYAYIGEFIDFPGFGGGPAPRCGITTDNMGEIKNCYYNRVRNYEGGSYYLVMDDLPAIENSGIIRDALAFVEEGRGHWKLIEPVSFNITSGPVSTNDLLDALNFKVEELGDETPSNWCDMVLGFDNQLLPVFCDFDVNMIDENMGDNNAVALSPNPTSGLVRIEGATAAEVRVYNAIGQLLKTARNANEVNLRGLPQGMYLLRITDEDGNTATRKVVME